MIAGQPPNNRLPDRVCPVRTGPVHEYRESCTSGARRAQPGSLQTGFRSPLAGIPQADGQQRLCAKIPTAGVGEDRQVVP